MSQGQGKLRASNEARGLSSSANDVEMMVNQGAEKDQPMDVSVVHCPQSADQQKSDVVITENHCMDDTVSTNDQCKSQMAAAEIEEQLTSSPDLVKTLKTVKALKKTFHDTFVIQKPEEQDEQTKETNLQTDNIVGKEEEERLEVEATAATPQMSSQMTAESTLNQISVNKPSSQEVLLQQTTPIQLQC